MPDCSVDLYHGTFWYEECFCELWDRGSGGCRGYVDDHIVVQRYDTFPGGCVILCTFYDPIGENAMLPMAVPEMRSG